MDPRYRLLSERVSCAPQVKRYQSSDSILYRLVIVRERAEGSFFFIITFFILERKFYNNSKDYFKNLK